MSFVPSLGTCTPAELPGLLGELDRQFILRKGRTLGLARRFPRLFRPENLQHVQVARVDGRVVAAAAAQPFTFVDGPRHWRCAAVGAVWTHPDLRGRGLASGVLRALAESQAQEGTQALVLWTTLHVFYGALGWRLDDQALFGTVHGLPGQVPELAPLDLAATDLTNLECLRARYLGSRVLRAPIDWQAIPIPATEVAAHVSPRAYALVGCAGETAYLYELVGEEAGLGTVWRSVLAGRSRVHVNACADASAAWLKANQVLLEPQRLAMWLPLVAEAEALAGRLTVPYLDRI